MTNVSSILCIAGASSWHDVAIGLRVDVFSGVGGNHWQCRSHPWGIAESGARNIYTIRIQPFQKELSQWSHWSISSYLLDLTKFTQSTAVNQEGIATEMDVKNIRDLATFQFNEDFGDIYCTVLGSPAVDYQHWHGALCYGPPFYQPTLINWYHTFDFPQTHIARFTNIYFCLGKYLMPNEFGLVY